MDRQIAAMLTWEQIVALDDAEKQQQIIKIVNKFFDSQEHTEFLKKAQKYAYNLNYYNTEPRKDFKQKYGLYKSPDGKWKSSVKYMVRSN